LTVPFPDRLESAIQAKNSRVCVGIDPRAARLPTEFRPPEGASVEAIASAIADWAIALLDVVAPLVPIVKPQIAFFEAYGAAGFHAFERTVAAARERGVLVLSDVKRGDIGSTSEAYAQGHFGHIGADAVTLNPYLGLDTLEPFLHWCRTAGKGMYVLVRTSNPGAADLQDLVVGDAKVHEHLAARLAEIGAGEGLMGASGVSSVGAVVGATYPEELAALRTVMPTTPLLVPGYGAQGGGAEGCRGAFLPGGRGAVVSSSRGITFAFGQGDHAERFGDPRWRESVEAAVVDMRDALNGVCTPAA
jgi:orotidine-5'-phosphate decarboxylase